MSAPAHRSARRRGGAIDDVICVVAVLVVLGLLLPPAWFVVAEFIVAITAPALFLSRLLPEGVDDAGNSSIGGASDGGDRR